MEKTLLFVCDLREKVDEVREKMEKLVARTSSSLGSRIDRVRKDGAQNKDDIAAVRFEVSRAKANSRQDLHIWQKSIFYYLWIDNPS